MLEIKEGKRRRAPCRWHKRKLGTEGSSVKVGKLGVVRESWGRRRVAQIQLRLFFLCQSEILKK